MTITFYQIPVMLNVVYQIHLSDSWKVYVGAGVGGVIGIHRLRISRPRFSQTRLY